MFIQLLAQIRMKNFYEKISSFNSLLILSIISLLIILVIDFYLYDIPELFIGGNKLGGLIYNLCLAYLGSFIFYFFVVHLKEKRDKMVLDPYVAEKSRTVIHSGKIIFKYLTKISEEKLNAEYPTLNEVETMCLKINPNSNIDGWYETNWLGLFRHYIIESEKGIKSMYDKVSFLDAELVRILGDIQSTPHYNAVNTGPKSREIGNTDLSQFSKHLFQYFELIKRLEQYCEKNISEFKKVVIEL